MKSLATAALLLGTSLLAFAETPKGLSDTDWSSIRAAYDAGRHAFHPQADGTLTAANPGLGWTMTFDDKGFTATSANNTWTWGLELISSSSYSSSSSSSSSSSNRLELTRPNGLTEWFINDTRGLEQGWTLTQSVGPLHLRVRGSLPASVSAQSISFGGQITYSGLKAWDANGQPIPTHFEPTAEGFAVHYDDTGAQYPITIDPLAQNAYLKASNTGAGDGFGSAVAVSGDTVVVGAPSEDSSSNSSPNESAPSAGAAYVFVRSGASWSQQAYLKASNTGSDDRFAISVAISGDTVVVGALAEDSSSTGSNSTPLDPNSTFDAGAAYVFIRSGASWSEQAYLKASNTGAGDQFAVSVAVSGDTVVVGAPFEDSSTSGINSSPLDPNSTFDAGAAYVFVRSGSSWSEQSYLKASNTGGLDIFGSTVAISGDTVVVGAQGEDSSTTGINSSPNEDAVTAGAAYVFIRSGSSWSQQAYLKASNTGASDQFAISVAISGDTVVVGAQGEDSSTTGSNSSPNELAGIAGAAYVFIRSGSSWSQQAYLKASNTGALDAFGNRVAVSGDTVVVGASGEDSSNTGIDSTPNEAANAAGAAYVFVRSGSSWSQQAYLKASNTGAGDQFAISVAISGDTVLVGAFGEDSNATGINGFQANDSAGFSGAAYVFNIQAQLTGLARTSYSAPGAVDISFGKLGAAAIDPAGGTLFDATLSGAGAPAAGNQGTYSTLGLTPDLTLLLQKGTALGGILGLPANAKVTALGSPVANVTGLGLFQATVSGIGISAANNRLLFKDTGTFIAPILRTGQDIAALGNARLKTTHEVLHGSTHLAIPYSLSASTASAPTTTAANDSGLLSIDANGTVISTVFREDATAIDGGGKFGQFRPTAAISSAVSFFTITKFIPTGSTPRDAFFSPIGRANLKQGDPAPGLGTTAKMGTFFGVAGAVCKTSLTGVPTAENESLWDMGTDTLLLRKGQTVGGTAKVARIIRFWTTGSQHIVHVQLTGTGVTPANNSAVVLVQNDLNLLILARTGDAAPGHDNPNVKLSKFSIVEVEPINGHYAILASLTGTSSAANQALFQGTTTLGNDGPLQALRLPKRTLRKGHTYSTANTPGALIRSIALNPAPDPTGAGGRGLRQIINANGQILLTLTGDRNTQELVRLTP